MFRLLKNNIGAASWPAAKKTFSDPIDGTTIMVAASVTTVYDEVEAMQTYLGALGAGNTQGYACSLMDLLQGLRIGTKVTYVGAAELSVAAGRIAFEAGGKYRLRENTSATSVDWGDIDTGAEGDATYYVYAVADAEATTFTVQISLNATTPDSGTYYKRLGTFVNDTDITRESVKDDLYNTFSTYDSGWFAVAAATNYPKTHSLNTTKCIVELHYSENSDGSNPMQAVHNWNDAALIWKDLTATTIDIQTGTVNVGFTVADNGVFTAKTSGYARVIIRTVEA